MSAPKKDLAYRARARYATNAPYMYIYIHTYISTNGTFLGPCVLTSYSVPGSPRSALVPDSGTSEGPQRPYAESSSHRP
jgi:hypothetical protein